MDTRVLNGRWAGEYTYGLGYEIDLVGKSVSFIMQLTFDGHLITGTCVDEESKDLFNQPATIEGVFDNKYISIIKKYPCLLILNENNELQAVRDITSLPIHYTGTLRRKGLLFRYFFEGEWEVTTPIKDQAGIVQCATGLGTWTMIK